MPRRSVASLLGSAVLLACLLYVPPSNAQKAVVSWAVEVNNPLTVSAWADGVAVLAEVRDTLLLFGEMKVDGPPLGLVAAEVSASGLLEGAIAFDTRPVLPVRRGIAVTASGDIYVGSSFADTLRFEEETITGATSRALFVGKFSSSFAVEWLVVSDTTAGLFKGFRSLAPGVARVRSTDSAVYVLGMNGPAYIPATEAGAFLAQYSHEGEYRWSVWIRDTGRAGGQPHDLASTGDGGAFVTAGVKTREVVVADTTIVLDHIPDTQHRSHTIILARFDANGQLKWHRLIRGIWDLAQLSATGDGGLVLGATYDDSVYVGSTPVLVPERSTGAFVARFDAFGALSWIREVSVSAAPDVYALMRSLDADSAGNAHLLLQTASSTEAMNNLVELVGLDAAGEVRYRLGLPSDWPIDIDIGYVSLDGAGNLYAWTGDHLVKVRLGTVSNGLDHYEYGLDAGIEVFPNPAGDHATIEYTVGTPAQVIISISDVLGRRLLLMQEPQLQEGLQRRNIDTSRLAAGLYHLQLTAGSESRVARLVVVR